MTRLPPPAPDPDPQTCRLIASVDAALAGNLCGRILRLEAAGQITPAAARDLLLGVHEMFRAVTDFASRVRLNDEVSPSVN